MKKRFEAFSMNGIDNKVVKSFKNEPEALAFARTHNDMLITKKDTDGSTYIWNERHERWENRE